MHPSSQQSPETNGFQINATIRTGYCCNRENTKSLEIAKHYGTSLTIVCENGKQNMKTYVIHRPSYDLGVILQIISRHKKVYQQDIDVSSSIISWN